jgi:hypothetical protein
MEAWIDQLAEVLGEDPLTERETSVLLRAARDVAHRLERRVTPLSTFLAGAAVGRSMAGGASRQDALEAALDTIDSMLPPSPPEGA